MANYILYLKQLYPPIAYREIARIVGRKFGYKTSHHTVKSFLTRHPVPEQLGFVLETFHEFEDAHQARWTVVRMYYEGWKKQSIACLLRLSVRHVSRLIKAFERDGFAGLEDKRNRPAYHPHNQLTLPFLEEVFAVQKDYPRAGRFRVHGLLERKLGEDTPSQSSVGRAMAYNRVLRGAPGPWPPPDERSDLEPNRCLFSLSIPINTGSSMSVIWSDSTGRGCIASASSRVIRARSWPAWLLPIRMSWPFFKLRVLVG